MKERRPILADCSESASVLSNSSLRAKGFGDIRVRIGFSLVKAWRVPFRRADDTMIVV